MRVNRLSLLGGGGGPVMGKWAERFREKNGRLPTAEEVQKRKQDRRSSVASMQGASSSLASGHSVAVTMHRIVKGTKEHADDYFLMGGATSKRPTIIKLDGCEPVTTHKDLVDKATRTFSSTAAGWNVFVGSQALVPSDARTAITSLVFVGTDEDWKEQFQLAYLSKKNGGDVAIFVREVIAPRMQSTPGAVANADLEFQSTPTELKQAVRFASSSSAKGRSRARSSLGQKSRESASEEGSEEDSENETIGQVKKKGQTKLENMKQQLESVVAKLKEPQFDGIVLTNKIPKAGVYLAFDPKELTDEMIDETGKLKDNTLWLGCTKDQCCKGPLGGAIEGPSYKVACGSGARAFAADGSARLKSVKAMLNGHENAPVHLGTKSLPSSYAKKTNELNLFKIAFPKATAVAQLSAAESSTTGSVDKGKKATLAAAEAPSNATVLRLPFDTPKKASEPIDIYLTEEQVAAANTKGSFVSEDVVEVLRHFEFESFLNSLEPKVRTIVKNRAVYIKTTQWHALCKKSSLAGMLLGGTKPGPGSDLEVQDNDESTDDLNSYWLLLQTKLNLSESMNAVDLVYCPVFDTLSGGHFASVFLLPAISKAIHMDSLATCGLYELATQVLSPFFAFCLNAEASSVIPLLRKDHTAGIEMQQSGSNVCAFTATLFLQKALTKLKELYQAEAEADEGEAGDEGESAVARQTALYEYLKGLQTAATSYQRRRQNACRDITDLIAQYTAHRKRKAEGEPAKSQESKGAKLPSGAVDALELSESGDYSSDVPSSDSLDE